MIAAGIIGFIGPQFALGKMATNYRKRRRLRPDEAVGKASIKMLFPIVIFTCRARGDYSRAGDAKRDPRSSITWPAGPHWPGP
jgi:hypothetical protein